MQGRSGVKLTLHSEVANLRVSWPSPCASGLPKPIMLPPDYQLVHQIPGRIRIRIPALLKASAFADRLARKIARIEGVTHVRINPLASSVVINFDVPTLSSDTLQAQVQCVLRELASPAAAAAPPTGPGPETGGSKAARDDPTAGRPKPKPKPPSQGAARKNALDEPTQRWSVAIAPGDTLTPYEQKQIEAIADWRTREPGLLTTFGAKLLTPVKALGDRLMPAAIVDQALALCEKFAAYRQTDWEKLKPEARVEKPADLQQACLETCDRLAQQVEDQALVLASAEGGIAGVFEEVGELTEIPLSIVLAVRTIHKIGLCYGYASSGQHEQLFAWSILAVSTAQTPQERRQAFSAFYHCQQQLYRQAFDQILEETLETGAFDALRQAVFRQAIAYLAEDLSGDDIPVVGILLGAAANRSFLAGIGESARRAFQLRWLLANHKLRMERTAPSASGDGA